MIERCIDEQLEFGIVWADERGERATGCACEVARLLRRHDDGRLDILARGIRPLQVVERHDGAHGQRRRSRSSTTRRRARPTAAAGATRLRGGWYATRPTRSPTRRRCRARRVRDGGDGRSHSRRQAGPARGCAPRTRLRLVTKLLGGDSRARCSGAGRRPAERGPRQGAQELAAAGGAQRASRHRPCAIARARAVGLGRTPVAAAAKLSANRTAPSWVRT